MQIGPVTQSTKKATNVIAILLVIMLLGSVGANIWQYRQSTATQYQLNTQIKFLKSDLEKSSGENKQLRTELDASAAQALEAISTLEAMKTKYDQLNDRNIKANADLTAAKERLNFVNCKSTISKRQIEGITTNQGLADLITQSIEFDYGLSSVDTNYSLIWNNSKSAIFSIQMSDRTTAKVAVTWSWNVSGRLLAIYNMGEGCYFYSYL